MSSYVNFTLIAVTGHFGCCDVAFHELRVGLEVVTKGGGWGDIILVYLGKV